MKTTKTALKKKVKEARDAYDKAMRAWESDPKVVRLRKELRDAEGKAQEKNDSKIDKAYAALTAAQKKLREFKETNAVSIPERIASIVRRCMAGTDYGPEGLVVEWVSPKERFAIVVQPGHTYWANMFEPSKYGRTERTLLDVEQDDPDHTGTNLYRDVMVKKHEGRFLKAVKSEWLAYVAEQEDE